MTTRTLLGPRRILRLTRVAPAVAVGFGRPGDGYDAPAAGVRVGLTASAALGSGSPVATTPSGAPVTKTQVMVGLLMIAGVGVGAGALAGWLLPATVGRIALGALAGGASVLALPVVATVLGTGEHANAVEVQS